MNCLYNISPNFRVMEMRQEPVIINITTIDEETAAEFREAMMIAHNSGQGVIPIMIDSYGGNVHSLLSMVDIIRSAKIPVATIVIGKALGSAGVLAGLGTKGYRFMCQNSSIMLNNVSKESWGKTDEFKPDSREVERLHKLTCQLLDRSCSKDDGYFELLIKDKGGCDWYLEVDDAVDYGLIDHIGLPWFEVNIQQEYEFDGITMKENIDEID